MTAGMAETAKVRLQFAMPPPDLAPYISTFYYTETGEGEPVEDWMHPEWANLRVGRAAIYEAGVGKDPLRSVPEVVVSGPTSHAMRFRIAGGRFWGVGLLPLGWARFVGRPASDFADEFHDIVGETDFAAIAEVLRGVASTTGDIAGDVERLVAGFRNLPVHPVDEEAIVGVHEALVAQRDHSVASLAQAAGMTVRTLERFCKRAFGFTPKLLIRRQRFLRSLARFMLDPDCSWIGALDGQYFDQAQFVREFRRFMTMAPSEYAALPKPILTAAVIARTQAAGDAMQVLQKPVGGSAAAK